MTVLVKLWQILKRPDFHLLLLRGSHLPPICPHFSFYCSSEGTVDLGHRVCLSWHYHYSLLREIRLWFWQRAGMRGGTELPHCWVFCSLCPKDLYLHKPTFLDDIPKQVKCDFFSCKPLHSFRNLFMISPVKLNLSFLHTPSSENFFTLSYKMIIFQSVGSTGCQFSERMIAHLPYL